MMKRSISLTIVMLALLATFGCATTMTADERAAEQIKDNLADNVDLAAQEIVVIVNDGVATLTGEVVNQQQKVAAIAAAAGVVGEDNVVDRLTIPTQFGS